MVSLPWERTVTVEEPELHGWAAPAGVLEAFFPRNVPWGGVRPATELRRITGTVPAFGYAFLPLDATPAGDDLSSGKHTIENAFYRVTVDPKTGASRDLFAGTGLGFDSFIMGKHQHLANGNWLITPTIQGRVIEATPEGRIVREYNNILNADYNALVLYAEHLEPGYLAKVPACVN